MMKKCFLFFIPVLLITLLAYPQVQVKKVDQKKQIKKVEPKKIQTLSSIKVLYPNGGETWDKGNRYTIRWTSQGVKGNVKIMLKYGPGRGSWYPIAKSTSNTGSYTFTLPRDFLQEDKDCSYEKYWYYIFVMTLDEKIKDSSDKSFLVRTKPGIRVVFPNGGEKLVRFGEYKVRWHSSGRVGPVRVSFENTEKKGVYSTGEGPFGSSAFYLWKVPKTLPLGKYKLHVSSVRGNIKDTSDRAFEIIPPNVDLVSGILSAGKVIKKKKHIFYTERKSYMRFEVYVKNNGTKILNRVPIMWSLLKQPGNIVISQDEAGFGNVFPSRMYKTRFEFKCEGVEYNWIFRNYEKKLKKGDYSFVFEADARNELGEPEEARSDNKCEFNFKIK